MRWSAAFLLVANELAYHAYQIQHGEWTVQSSLPLNIFSMMIFISAAMLAARGYMLYEFRITIALRLYLPLFLRDVSSRNPRRRSGMAG